MTLLSTIVASDLIVMTVDSALTVYASGSTMYESINKVFPFKKIACLVSAWGDGRAYGLIRQGNVLDMKIEKEIGAGRKFTVYDLAKALTKS